jgi:hypothetical protein
MIVTSNSSIFEDKIKSFATYCDVCAFNGFPYEKVVYEYGGLRSEDEEGFIYNFTEYEYPLQKRVVHVHKWNHDLINTLVNQSLGNSEDPYNGYCGGAEK